MKYGTVSISEPHSSQTRVSTVSVSFNVPGGSHGVVPGQGVILTGHPGTGLLQLVFVLVRWGPM